MRGLILNGSKNVFEVECDDGLTRFCSIKGKILKTDKEYYNPLAPGDYVELEDSSLEDDKGLIVKLLPRKNEFVRWNIKKREPQLLAANLDYLLIVTTPNQPPFRPRFIDRALAQAEYQEITPIIVCNKYDLAESQNPDFQRQLSTWEEVGYKVMRISEREGCARPLTATLVVWHWPRRTPSFQRIAQRQNLVLRLYFWELSVEISLGNTMCRFRELLNRLSQLPYLEIAHYEHHEQTYQSD